MLSHASHMQESKLTEVMFQSKRPVLTISQPISKQLLHAWCTRDTSLAHLTTPLLSTLLQVMTKEHIDHAENYLEKMEVKVVRALVAVVVTSHQHQPQLVDFSQLSLDTADVLEVHSSTSR